MISMQPTESELQATLQTFIQDDLLAGTQEVGPDDQLLMDGIVDSVGVMRLVAFIEEQLGIKVPPTDFTIENFGTLRDLTSYLIR